MNASMQRKDFIQSVCTIGACSCVGMLAAGLDKVSGQESASSKPGDPLETRAIQRMEFADIWVKRFINVLDQTLDEETRTKVMMTNGATCYREWIESTGQEAEAVPFEEWAAQAREKITDGSLQIEGNVITYQYLSSAETGEEAQENVCLCPMVESKPAGLSKTYCQCSIGYVKEMFEQKFARPVDVQLVDSVLYGGKRCQFRITVS